MSDTSPGDLRQRMVLFDVIYAEKAVEGGPEE